MCARHHARVLFILPDSFWLCKDLSLSLFLNVFLFLDFFFFFFGLTILLIYLGFAESSLLCGLSLVLASGDYSLVVAHGLLLVVASLVVDHRL